jgi:hypothetical protein
MKKILLFLFLLILNNFLQAQSPAGNYVLSGKIYDATHAPIPGVAVYLDGTSIHVITNASGEFRLSLQAVINTRLILHHISYEQIVIPEPFKTMPSRFVMTEKANQIEPVVFEQVLFSRQQMLEAFRIHFLGATQAGKSCRIDNEDDIRLVYNLTEKTLNAYCDVPIRIHNEYLAYDISFNLASFKMVVSENNLQSPTSLAVNFTGTSFFQDLAIGNRRMRRRREDAYRHSLSYFMQNLINNTIEDTDFEWAIPIYEDDEASGESRLAENIIKEEPALFFNIGVENDMKVIELTSEPVRRALGEKMPEETIYEEIVIQELTPDREWGFNRSALYFLKNRYWIDGYGNIAPISDIYVEGYLAEKRMGDILPSDFELRKK